MKIKYSYNQFAIEIETKGSGGLDTKFFGNGGQVPADWKP